MATWELYRKQFDTGHIFAVDEVILEDRQAYYRALDHVEAHGGDISGWVEYSSETVFEALERTWKRIDSIRAITGGKVLSLTKNQERLLALLKEAPRGIQEIMSALKVTKPGAYFVIKPLLADGLIKRTGGHKTGKYSNKISKNWRGQRGPKANFLKHSLIGETHFLPPINLTLPLFRVTGYEGKKFLSAAPPPR